MKTTILSVLTIPFLVAGCVNISNGPNLATTCSNANLAYSAFTIAAAEEVISEDTYNRATNAHAVITEVCANPGDTTRENLQTALEAYSDIVAAKNEVE